ncbi:MAG: TetR/AcrR family transcriptional regulator [Pseudomonadota bacterium]
MTPAIEESPWATRADKEKERATKRDAVLRTAVRFFNEKGFHSTSLDDVASALNVTKPTIYHYFSNKDEILFECINMGFEAIREAASKAARQGGSGMVRLQALMLEYALIKTRPFGICVTRTTDDQLRPDSRKKFRAGKREINTIIETVLAEGMADGSIRKADPRIVAFTLAGSLNWIARWYDPEGDLDAQEVANGVVDTLVNGLRPQ